MRPVGRRIFIPVSDVLQGLHDEAPADDFTLSGMMQSLDERSFSLVILLLVTATAHGRHDSLPVAGVAGLVLGSTAMAAGDYVSVYLQADTEHADLRCERAELEADKKEEHRGPAAIYVGRGLDPLPAKRVAAGIGVLIGTAL